MPRFETVFDDFKCAADGEVPLWLILASGNEHDSKQFASVVKAFRQQWTSDGVFVTDAAFYTESNLQQTGSIGWRSRVPLALKGPLFFINSVFVKKPQRIEALP